MEIETPRLRLVLQSVEDTLARIDAMSPEDRAEVSPEWLEHLRASPASDPWIHGFGVIESASGVEVGSGAFKGPPDENGVVEIAYGINADHRNRGYAGEVASALVDFAFEHPEVRAVRAHTLRENNPSTKVLSKCGFAHVGEVIDPDDGPVWRWELKRQDK